jgi:pimeloyl-ACP methyl ester carboxylesterase
MNDYYVFTPSGDKLYYEVYNEASTRVIIFLHGNGESSKLWNKLIPYIDNYKVILIDTIGHGKSCDSSKHKRLNFSLLADDLLAVINTLKLTNIYYIIGYSDGGNILLEVIRRKLNISKELILISPNLNKRDIRKKCLMFLIKLSTIVRYPLFFIKRVRNKIKVNNLMIKEPNYTLDDFDSYNQNISIIASDNDFVLLEPLEAFCKKMNASFKIIPNTNHFNIIYSEYFIQFLQSLGVNYN